MSIALSSPATLHAGFNDPVDDGQRAFRAILQAMSHPAASVALDLPLDPPPGLDPATAASCLALLDFDTPLWADGGVTPAHRDWLRFHAGVPFADRPAEAAFALILDPAGMPPLESFPLGTDRAPELGATLLLQLPRLRDGEGPVWRGPGFAAPRAFTADGLKPGFWAERAALLPLYPRGLDMILASGRRIAALPRTTEPMEG